MKTREAIHKLFDQLEQAQQNLDAQEQRREHAQEELRQQKSAARAAEEKITDRAKITRTRAQLLDYTKELREQVKRAKADLGASTPDQTINDLRAILTQSQERETQLRIAAEQIARLAPLAERARVIRSRVRLSDQVGQIQNALCALETADPALMTAYEQLEHIQAQIAERERARAAIAEKARWLGDHLPGGRAKEWADLALEDIRKLSAALGRSQSRLSTQVEEAREKANDLKTKVAAREKKLKPAQQDVAEWRAQAESQQVSLANEAEETREWAAALEQRGYGELNPTSDEALTAFAKQMRAKRAALEWFSQNVTPSPRG